MRRTMTGNTFCSKNQIATNTSALPATRHSPPRLSEPSSDAAAAAIVTRIDPLDTPFTRLASTPRLRPSTPSVSGASRSSCSFSSCERAAPSSSRPPARSRQMSCKSTLRCAAADVSAAGAPLRLRHAQRAAELRREERREHARRDKNEIMRLQRALRLFFQRFPVLSVHLPSFRFPPRGDHIFLVVAIIHRRRRFFNARRPARQRRPGL